MRLQPASPGCGSQPTRRYETMTTTANPVVEFSPSDELNQTMAVVMANVEAMQTG